MTGLSRYSLSKKYKIPYSTLRQWEEASRISYDYVQRLIKLFNSINIIVSDDWLINGTGPEPYINKETDRLDLQTGHHQIQFDDVLALIEAKEYEKKYINSIVINISDQAMNPLFKPGDYVGGFVTSTNNMDLWIGDFAIVILQDGSTLFRKILWSQPDKEVALVAINPLAKEHNRYVKISDIKHFAPLYWHRILRKDKITTYNNIRDSRNFYGFL
ncbi:MAG: hypothetical protein J0G32_03775 [Alphaproteobacteria bacterium]|nr:hypothetical protein [Alphaproteobacteria bacterium]